MKRRAQRSFGIRRWLTLALAVVGVFSLVAAHTGPEAQEYEVTLTELNDSGVTGEGTLTLARHGGQHLHVELQVNGVEPGQLHPQHIHGFEDHKKNATCPTEGSQDQLDGIPEEASNPDDLIGLEEGVDEYGGVLLPLKAFPTPDANSYEFSETYRGEELSDLQPVRTSLPNRHIVIHGDFVQSNDGQTYVATLPIACGQIEPTG